MTLCSDIRILILTGYSSVTTAVEAIKLGAINYLCKPASTDELLAAFTGGQADPGIDIPGHPPSIERVECTARFTGK